MGTLFTENLLNNYRWTQAPHEAIILSDCGIVIRTSTERLETINSGDSIIADVTGKEFLRVIDMVITLKERRKHFNSKQSLEYNDTCVSIKMVRNIQFNLKIITRMVWRKDSNLY